MLEEDIAIFLIWLRSEYCDMSNGKERRRLHFFVLFLAALVLLIVGRLVQLMIFTPKNEPPGSITLPVVERGPVLDRNGKILAISTRLDSVSACMMRKKMGW